MAHRYKARNEVAIVGYAHSAVQRHSDMPLGAITIDVVRKAIADAGLTPADIDGFTTGSILPSSGGHGNVDGIDIVTASWVYEKLGLHPRWSSGFQGYGQIPGSVLLAAQAVASGTADYVVVHRALANPRGGKYHVNPMTEAEGGMQWSAPQGFLGPPAGIAMSTNDYMLRYGRSRSDLGEVVVELRAAGSQIPWSYWYGKPLSHDDYMNARLIADPICLFDCDIPVDGAAAFVFTTAERAADLPNDPVYVTGWAQGTPSKPTYGGAWDLDDIYEGGRIAVERLWEHTGVGLDDIDLPQLYDGFSPFIWYWLEVLGYCGPGEAPDFLRTERARQLKPMNSGGALGNGRMHGVPQMLEAYLQLAGRAGDRQLPDLRMGLACHSSPHYGGVVVYSNERF